MFCLFPTEVSKQFALFERHINRIRACPELAHSEIVVLIERNLGQEAAHHQAKFHGVPGLRFRIDHKHSTYGVLMDENVKYQMCTLMNNYLRDQRVSLRQPLLSEDPEGMRKRLREQMSIYSLQFKEAADAFSKQRQILSGKVGGMKDDVVIALQIVTYFSKEPHMYA